MRSKRKPQIIGIKGGVVSGKYFLGQKIIVDRIGKKLIGESDLEGKGGPVSSRKIQREKRVLQGQWGSPYTNRQRKRVLRGPSVLAYLAQRWKGLRKIRLSSSSVRGGGSGRERWDNVRNDRASHSFWRWVLQTTRGTHAGRNTWEPTKKRIKPTLSVVLGETRHTGQTGDPQPEFSITYPLKIVGGGKPSVSRVTKII